MGLLLGPCSSPPPHPVPGFAASMRLGDSSKSFAVFQCCASSFLLESWIERALCSARGSSAILSIGLRPRLVSLDVSQTWNKVFAQMCC